MEGNVLSCCGDFTVLCSVLPLPLHVQVFQDPAMLKTAAEMMKSMPPDQLKAAFAQAGQHLPPGTDLSPDMLSQMADAVAKMPPEQLKAMSEAARSQTAGSGLGGSTAAAAAASSSGREVAPAAGPGAAAPFAAGGMPDMSAMMNSSMMKMAAEMMKNMSAEDMAAMTQMMAGGEAPSAASAYRWGCRAMRTQPALVE